VKNASVTVLPSPVKAKTLQIGSMWQSNRFTLDVDAYQIKFDNAYSSSTDAQGEVTFFSNGESTSKGIEAESNVILGGGFSVYVNGTYGSAKYGNGLWIANAPSDTETLSLNFKHAGWDAGVFAKRVGKLYNDNGATHQAVAIDSFVITNLFVNYTIDNLSSVAKQAKIQFGINNLFDKHSIVGVTPATTTTSVAAPGDVLTLLAARSLSLALTVSF
jgi:iron complex outermembrane receptor protein